MNPIFDTNSKEITVNINGNDYIGKEGDTIIAIARKAGIEIPTLCSDPRLKPGGSCRMCMVQIEGRENLMPSCAFKATDGMRIQTDSEKVIETRKERIKFLMEKYHPSTESPDSTGGSRLLTYALEYNVPIPQIQKEENLVIDNEAFKLDLNKCIRCGICVKVTQDLQHCNAINFVGSPASENFTFSFDDDACVRCGNCISACPVDALMTKKTVPYVTAEVEKVQSTCQYCGVGCQIDYHVDKNGKIVQAEPVMDALNNGLLCVKGRFGYDYVQDVSRLQTPLIRTNEKKLGIKPEWREATWDEALDLVAKRMTEIKEKHGSSAFGFVGSGKSSNEADFMHQKLARAIFGTNNYDVSSRLCHGTTSTALVMQFGSGAMTNSISDLETADVIFQIGGNAEHSHPIIGKFFHAAKKRGTFYINAEPRKVGSAYYADIHMQQNLGTDVALINGMIHHIISSGLENKEFIEKNCENFDEMWEIVKEYSPERASTITGVPVEKIKQAAEAYAKAKAAAITWGMGVAQRTTAVRTVWSLANLALVCGHIGRPGTGLNPLRGQNNVQGSGDMGAPNLLPGYQIFNEKYAESLGLKPEIATTNREKFEKVWGCELSDKMGLTQLEMTEAGGRGEIKCMYYLGSDPGHMQPDINVVQQDLTKMEFMVVQDLFMTNTAELADVVLPACSNLEIYGTVTNTERRVQLLRPVIAPIGKSRPDYEITLDLMKRLGYEDYLSGQNNQETAQNILNEINMLVPQYAGVNHEKIERRNNRYQGVRWPIAADQEESSPWLYANGFPKARIPLKASHYVGLAEPSTEDYPLILITIRELYQYDNSSMTGKTELLNKLDPYGTFVINPKDAEKYGVVEGDTAKLISKRGESYAKIKIDEGIMPGQVYSDFHHAETLINKVTTSERDPIAKEPELKACAVQLVKVSTDEYETKKATSEEREFVSA